MGAKFDAFGAATRPAGKRQPPRPKPKAPQARQTPLERLNEAIDHSLPKLPGWCTTDKAKRMAHYVELAGQKHAPLCVELGVFGGRSLLAMSLAVHHLLGGKGTVFGIDPYTADAALETVIEKEHQDWWSAMDYEDILRQARAGIAKHGLNTFTKILVQRSQEAAPDFLPGSIDVCHQDSNHSEQVSCGEVAAWAPKMRDGGFWIFDDTNWASTQLAQKFLLDLGFQRIESHESWAVFLAPANCAALQPALPEFSPVPGEAIVIENTDSDSAPAPDPLEWWEQHPEVAAAYPHQFVAITGEMGVIAASGDQTEFKKLLRALDRKTRRSLYILHTSAFQSEETPAPDGTTG
jgi:predicted O-methyltransferase YrrM